METDLSIRLHAYATAAEAQLPASTTLYADALACSLAASAAASAGIICSHTRILRGDSPPDDLLTGQDELDILVADKPAIKPADNPGERDTNEPPSEDTSPSQRLPLRPGKDTMAVLALGAAGIPAIKSQHV